MNELQLYEVTNCTINAFNNFAEATDLLTSFCSLFMHQITELFAVKWPLNYLNLLGPCVFR